MDRVTNSGAKWMTFTGELNTPFAEDKMNHGPRHAVAWNGQGRPAEGSYDKIVIGGYVL
jgi:hypothetical protein